MQAEHRPSTTAGAYDNSPSLPVLEDHAPNVRSMEPETINYAVTTADGASFFSRDRAADYMALHDAKLVGNAAKENERVTFERLQLWGPAAKWLLAGLVGVLLALGSVLAALDHMQLAAVASLPSIASGGAAWLVRKKAQAADPGPP
jgi:hypothetical protein